MTETKPIIVRAILSGNHSVGKSSLMRREAQDSFSQDCTATVGIEFKSKMYEVDHVAVKGQFIDWGFVNQNSTASGINNIYRNTQAVAFCFAINDRESFFSLHKVIEDVKQMDTGARLFLVGCKGDLLPQVLNEELKDYAKKNHLQYFSTSSLQNWGVNEVFAKMMEQGLPLRLAQLERQKKQKGNRIILKPPCRQNCEFM